MIEISIPGYGGLYLKHLVLDYNGTMACDGSLVDGVRVAFQELQDLLRIHVLTADTFGKAGAELSQVPCKLSILPVGNQDTGKQKYVRDLGADATVCIGNGRNDRLMLKEATLGIAVIQEETAAVETVFAADIVCRDINHALGLLTNHKRLVATLRS